MKQIPRILFAVLLFGCVNSWGDSISPNIYIGTYPNFIQKNSQIETPFLKIQKVKSQMKDNLPNGLLTELEYLETEMPIIKIEPDYLLIHLCEPHNCEHKAFMLFSTTDYNPTVILYNGTDLNPENIGTACFSNKYKKVSEIPGITNIETQSQLYQNSYSTQSFLKLECHDKDFNYKPQAKVDPNNA